VCDGHDTIPYAKLSEPDAILFFDGGVRVHRSMIVTVCVWLWIVVVVVVVCVGSLAIMTVTA